MVHSECGKDELLQVKEAVKKKIQSEDYIGARALIEESKAWHQLKNITSGMLLVCDILCAGNIDVPSYGTDWYWVLQVSPSADAATIETQNAKVTLALEELIKEEFCAAEKALKLVRGAYAVLVDRDRRSVFDHRRSSTWKEFCEMSSSCKLFELDGNDGETRAGMEDSITGSPSSSRMKRGNDFEAAAGNENWDRKGKRICTGSDTYSAALSEGKSEPVDHGLERRAFLSSEEIGCSSNSNAEESHNHSSSNLTQTRWSYKDFEEGQVWAIYGSSKDNMPRSYVKVVGVTSVHQVNVTLLEINPMLEPEIRWVDDSLPLACGVFRAGSQTATLNVTRFSHPVECDRSTKKTFFRISPRKGEVWAMYKDWSNKWSESDYVRAECYVVEILSDFNNDSCISTCMLEEVDGYLTFFKRRIVEGSMLFKKFSRMDFLCFSHRIPAYTVVGIEDPSVPNESWHLEPDALPLKCVEGSSDLCSSVTNQISVM